MTESKLTPVSLINFFFLLMSNCQIHHKTVVEAERNLTLIVTLLRNHLAYTLATIMFYDQPSSAQMKIQKSNHISPQKVSYSYM